MIAAGVILSITVLFKIENYAMEGDSPYPIEELILAFGHKSGENIFAFKISDAQENVGTALPYLEEITVRRRLPSTIVFKTKAAKETYYTPCVDGGYAVLSEQLKILRISADEPDLKLIEGLSPLLPKAGSALSLTEPDKLSALRKVLTELTNSSFADFTRLDLTNNLEISFIYENRVRVLLGTANDLQDKIALSSVVLSNNIGKTERGILDVSRQSVDKPRQGVWDPGEF